LRPSSNSFEIYKFNEDRNIFDETEKSIKYYYNKQFEELNFHSIESEGNYIFVNNDFLFHQFNKSLEICKTSLSTKEPVEQISLENLKHTLSF